MNLIRRIIPIFFAFVLAFAPNIHAEDIIENLGDGRNKVFRGKYHTTTDEGDTILVIVFNEITVFPSLKFKTKSRKNFIGALFVMSKKHCHTPN